MNKNFQPLNTQEELLYSMLIRLDALTDMMSSLLKVYADKNEIATEKVQEEIVKPTRKRKPVKAE